MHKRFFLSSLILISIILSTTQVNSRVDYVGMMVRGHFENVIKAFEEEKNLKNLFSEEGVILVHTLVMDGKIEDSKAYVDFYYKRFPKNPDYLELKRRIDIFTANLDEDIFSENQMKHLKFKKLDFTSLESESSLKEGMLNEILTLENEFYLPSKYDYAFALNNLNFFKQIEKTALGEVSSKRKVLFPKTLDFFQLAMAYKALAVIKIHEQKLDQARRFIKLAQSNIMKMRSIWLIEDLSIYNPIMKTSRKSTKFASLYPQYLIRLREEFSSFLI